MAIINTKLSKHIADTKGLLQEADFSQLEGLTLGIDLQYLIEFLYKSSKFNSNSNHNQLIFHLSNNEFDIISELLLDFVKKISQFKIKPYFVLPGLRNYAQFERILSLDASHGDNKFNGNFIDKLNISKWVNFFNKNGISDFIVAPYSSLTQLTYLFSEHFIDAIFGPSELLMFNKINRIILEVSLLENTFQFIDKFDVFDSLNITEQLEFTELMLILKNVIQPYSFIIVSIMGKTLKNIAEINNKNSLKLSYLNDKQQELLEKVILSLYAAPVFQLNGCIGIYNLLDLEIQSPVDGDERESAIDDEDDENEYIKYITKFNNEKLTKIDPPFDSYEFLGKKLPDEIVFYQSLGMFDEFNKVLEGIVYGTYLDSSNFNGLSLKTSLIENFEKFFFERKQKECKLIINCMTRYFHKQKFNYKNLNKQISSPFHTDTLQPTEIKALKRISFKIDPKGITSFKDYFKFDFAKETFTKLSVGESFDNVESLIMSVIWRVFVNFFDIAGDIETDDTSNTVKFMNSKHLSLIEKISSNLTSFKEDSDLETFITILLISQVASSNKDFEISVIDSKLIYQFKLLFKETFETVLVWSLLTGDFQRLKFETTKEWQKEFVSKLPFQNIDDIFNEDIQKENNDNLKNLISLI